jgi:RNA polymerase sigma factor (TIGR02999 family)
VLVDAARARRSLKRGADASPAALDEKLLVLENPLADIIALDDALRALSAIDARKNQVVELRFFGGLTVEETAEVLDVSAETVKRDWKLAKAWLRRELRRER